MDALDGIRAAFLDDCQSIFLEEAAESVAPAGGIFTPVVFLPFFVPIRQPALPLLRILRLFLLVFVEVLPFLRTRKRLSVYLFLALLA